MSDNSTEEEPSIEEILSSIRQIISDDDEDATMEETVEEEAAAEPDVAPEPEQDVVEPEPEPEAEEPVEEPEPEVEAEPEPEPEPEEPEEEDVFELTEDYLEEDDEILPEPEPVDLDFDAAEDEPAPTPEPVEEKPAAETVPDTDILSEKAASAALGGFTKLADSVRLGQGDATIHQIVQDLLKPMLAEWLDDNLPDIIERLVQQELDKLSGKIKK